MATLARTTFNNQLYKEISGSLSDALRTRLDQLLEYRGGRSRWDRLKREPKWPGVREVASLLQHIQELNALGDGLPVMASISVPKRTQLVIEARALDINDMRALKPAKRYALTVLLIQAQLQKAMDDIAEIFIKTVRSMHHIAEERLRQYKLEHADQTERLIGQFRDMLTAFHHEGTEPERLARIDRLLDGDPEPWIVRCDEHLAYVGNNYYPFMLQPYRSKRPLLFQCLEALTLRSSSQDDALLGALAWMQRFRSSHREWLVIEANDLAVLSFDWLPDKWEKLVFGKEQANGADRLINRKYFELV